MNDNSDAVASILDAVRSAKDESARLDAVEALVDLHSDAGEAVLVQLVNGSDTVVAVRAVMILGEFGSPEAIPAMEQAVGSRDPALATAAREALEQMSLDRNLNTPCWKREKPGSIQLSRDVIERLLNHRLRRLDFDDIELRNAIDFVRDISGIPIKVRWDSLKSKGISQTANATVHLIHTRFRNVLEALFESVNPSVRLAFVIAERELILDAQ